MKRKIVFSCTMILLFMGSMLYKVSDSHGYESQNKYSEISVSEEVLNQDNSDVTDIITGESIITGCNETEVSSGLIGNLHQLDQEINSFGIMTLGLDEEGYEEQQFFTDAGVMPSKGDINTQLVRHLARQLEATVVHVIRY